MASYNELNALIDAYINRNGVQAITGQILNGVLKAMVEQIGRGYALMGIASPNGDPGTPDAPESYFASEPGTYTNFGGRTVAPGEFALLYYIPSEGWFKETIYDGFQTVQASIDGNVGTPSVGVSYANGVLSFDFHNMKGNPGEPGEDGDAAGFGTIGADITGGVGTPGVSVESSGPATAKNLQFHFTNLKGETGITSVVVTVDNTTGNPTCTASLSGGVLTLAFTGLKGAQGNPGSSVDYPFTLVNNLTTDDPDQALTAAMGVQLESEITQLEQQLTLDETRKILPADITNVNNRGITSSSPYEVVAETGFRLWHIQVRAGQTITIHYNLASGWIISGSTANVPAVGDAVSNVVRTQYSSTTKQRSFTASSDCYFVFRLASAETNFYVDVPNEGFGADVREVIEAVQEEIDNDVLTKQAQELTDTEQTTVRNNIGVNKAIYGSKKNYFENGWLDSGTILYLDGVGVTDFIPYTPGTDIVWRFGGTGASNIRIESFDADKNFVGYFNSNTYTDTRTISFSNGNPSYIRASFHLQVDGVRNDKPVSIGGVDFVVHDSESGYTGFIESGVLEDERKWKPLPLGGLLNCDTDSNGHLKHSTTYDPLRVTTKSNICVPFPGCRLRFKVPDGLPYILNCYFWLGTSDGNHTSLSGSLDYFKDGNIITLPATALCIRPVFRGYTTSTSSFSAQVNAADIQALFDNGRLAIEYYDERNEDVVGRNEATQINLQALRRELIPGGGALNGMDSMPVFAHITDLHGDAPRWKNFLEYCDKYGMDFALETGDAVLYQKRDASQFIYDFANEHNTDVIVCIGNHEALPTGSSTLFADNLSDLATKYEYLASAGTLATKCYFYKDYDAKKVRVIVLNQHEDGVYRRRIGQAQVDWFIATLLSTPAGYGIVIAYHAPEDKVVAESPYDVFRQPEPNSGATYEANGAYVDKRVVELLVDAFISRTSANFTYEDHSATYNGDSDETTQTVSVVADFSEVDETTEFICYVCGHRHEDWIGYYDHSENKQLCLCITCGNALYGDSTNPAWSNQSDLPRGGVGVSQDAFCIYAIDRLNGNVKVMRVGATVTQMMVKREMMVIPYKD